MVSDEISWVEGGFKLLVGVAITVFGWLWSRLVNYVVKNHEDIVEHKLHVSENYVKKDVIERIHSRIDEMSENISDIKTLIVTTLNGNHK